MSSIHIEQNGVTRTLSVPADETLLSALRRAGYSIPAACGGKGRCGKCRVPVNGVPRLACRVYPADGDTVTLPESAGGAILTRTLPPPACQPGRTGCAAAVDLGTTTVVARLYDLASGAELATESGWNAQAPYGADVISRIQYTLEQPGGLQELSQRSREQVWALIERALARCGREADTLLEITLVGNTVMQHLFAGYSVRGIAAAPFQPETLFDASETVTLHGVPVHFAPCVAGYVGGDITAGLLAAGLAELPGEHLFLDIGTNGEMALGGRGGFTCCAVASGPAFEGAGISCGMPGVDGAVSRVQYDRGFVYDVIGGGVPKGLCGSGLLDLTAVLLRLGAIAPGGRLLPPEQAPAALRRHLTHDADGNGCFLLTPEVSLTAADVRNLQLAKAAVAAGIRVLLQQRGLTPEQLDGVYLAGGFGSYLDPESAAAIGMLPRACAGKLHTLGNTALAGAAVLTLDGAQWQRIRSISRACSYLELSGRADFAAAFTENLSFPQP